MRPNTSFQSWSFVWRKIRTVGYQGVSSRPTSQRQSAPLDSASHVGTPSAPARWTGAEQIVIITSRSDMSAAVSWNGPLSRSSSSPKSTTGRRSASGAICSTPWFFCRLINFTPGTEASGRRAPSRAERNRSPP